MTQIQRELLLFVVIPVVYSIAFFGWCYLAEKMPIFSKRNARSITMVACSHAAAVLMLILLSEAAFRFYASFPSWLTDPAFLARGHKYSIFELSCIAAVWLIGWAETRWIYVDSG